MEGDEEDGGSSTPNLDTSEVRRSTRLQGRQAANMNLHKLEQAQLDGAPLPPRKNKKAKRRKSASAVPNSQMDVDDG